MLTPLGSWCGVEMNEHAASRESQVNVLDPVDLQAYVRAAEVVASAGVIPAPWGVLDQLETKATQHEKRHLETRPRYAGHERRGRTVEPDTPFG